MIVYGPFVALLCLCFTAGGFSRGIQPERKQIAIRKAVGVYRAWIDQGGVSPVTTAQNKKTLPSPTDSVRCVTPPTRLRVIGTPFS